MSDLGFLPPQAPQQQVPISEAFKALGAGLEAAPPAASPSPLIASPSPPAPPVARVPAEVVQGWHGDPVKQALTEGFVGAYAKQMPGGMPQAAQHINTYQDLVARGLTKDDGLWDKFRNTPERMSSGDSAALAERLRSIGNATQQSPDLRFDPVGVVRRVGGDGTATVEYPPARGTAALDLRPLAPAGLDNLQRLAAIGAGTTIRAHNVGDALSGYLGLAAGARPTKQQLEDLTGALGSLAQAQGVDPLTIASQVSDGWRQIAPRQEPWKKPWALAVNGPNPAAAALEDQLSPKLVQALATGVGNVDFHGGKELSVTADPSGGLAVSAEPNVRNNKLLRHLYPALAQNGTTAWLPTKPAQTADTSRLNGHVTQFNGQIMDANGGHPAHQPGDHIMFEAAAKSPLATVDLGPSLATQPELSLDRLGPADIDPDKLSSGDGPLFTHAWAVLPGGNAAKVKLLQQGLKPIPHGGGHLVFGMTPEQALTHSSTAITNKGHWINGEFAPGEVKVGTGDTTKLLTGDVAWHMAPTNDEPNDDGHLRDVQVKVRKQLALHVGDLDSAVAQVQQSGGKNIVVYTHRNQLPGFKTAYEHVYTDGINYASHLGSTPSTEGHVVPVFVPDTTHVGNAPAQPQGVRIGSSGAQINGVSVLTRDRIGKLTDLKEGWLTSDGDALIPSTDPSDVRVTPSGLRIVNPSVDAANVARLARIAGANVGGFDPGRMDTNDRGHAVTISGLKTPQIKRTRPDQGWADRHGIEFDPGWRDGAGVKVIDPKVAGALEDVYKSYTSQFSASKDLWGLNRIAVTTGYNATPAYTEWGKLGGAIGLSAQHFSDPDQLAAYVAALASKGVIAGGGASYVLAHELGHVVHGALQFGSDGSGAKAPLLAIRKKLGYRGVANALSSTAAANPEEMVAESIAQRLSGGSSKLGSQVLQIIHDAYGRVMAARKPSPW